MDVSWSKGINHMLSTAMYANRKHMHLEREKHFLWSSRAWWHSASPSANRKRETL